MARSKNAWPLRATRVWAAVLLATVWSGLDARERPAPLPVQPIPLPPLPMLAAPPPAVPAPIKPVPFSPAAGQETERRHEGEVNVPIIRPKPPAAPTLGDFAVRRTTVAVPATRVEMPPSTEEWAGQPPRTLRRDPILPPLTQDQAWTEQLYAVTLNGQPVSDAAIFAKEGATGRLAVELTEARRWRLVIDEDKVLTLNGEAFYPLGAVAGAVTLIDEVDLTLALQVAPEALDALVIAGSTDSRPMVASGFGVFLDYDIQYLTGDGIDGRLDGLVEMGVFGKGGVFSNSMLASDLLSDEGELIRLETGYSRDFLERRASLRLGDGLAAGGAFGRPFRFGGIQWATNFGTDPSFVTFPLPTIGGLAENPSVVDVYVDDLQRYTNDVPAGPFQIDQLPVVTGAGELQVRVTDLLGRERIVTQPYYVSARMLRAGLHDYSYQAGALREDYAEDSFAYGGLFASATHRYGFSNSFTGELHLEASKDTQNLSLGGTLALGRYGTLSGGAGIGRSQDGEVGTLAQLDYEYQGRPFSLGVGTRLASSDWQTLGDDESGVAPARIDQARLGLDLGDFGSLGLFLIHRDEHAADDTLSAAASWSTRLGPGSVVLTAAKLIEPAEQAAFFLNYVLPIDGRDSASVGASHDGTGTYGEAQYRRSKGASDLGADWLLAARAGGDQSRVSGSLGYDWSKLSARVDAELEDGGSAIRPNLSGSLAVVDGRFDASRRLGRAFGVVDLPGMPDVRVYVENREVGRTDSSGRLLLPSLLPYQANQVRVEVEDLPLDAQVGDPQVTAVPADRSGMVVDFGIRRERQATVRLVDRAGYPLPGGLQLAGNDSTRSALVGRNGIAHVRGIGPDSMEVSGQFEEAFFTCRIPAYQGDDPMPDLGQVSCQ